MMDDEEYLSLLCSSAPHKARHFIRPIHATISIIYQILASLVLGPDSTQTLLQKSVQKRGQKKEK